MNSLLFLPEISFLALCLALLGLSIYKPAQKINLSWLPYASGAVVAVCALSLNCKGLLFGGAYQIDALSQYFKLLISIGFFFVSINALNQPTLKESKQTDYFFLMALSSWGLMLMASSVELITLYIALEISSYSLFAIVPLRAESSKAAEAGIKYILFGAAATAVSLYGYSYILAGQHTGYLRELTELSWSFTTNPGAVIGLIMFMAGFFYKLALFPFHFWCPDVYDGSSNETAAFVATLPKLGAVVVLIRLCSMLSPDLKITTMLAILAAVSITYGNLTALAQKDLKRMLGYSSISHAGYVIIGLVAGTAQGLAAAAFYSLVYLLMTLACFWVIGHIDKSGRNLSYSDLDGLHSRNPFAAFILAIAAFSLVGLPPTGGFMGKLFLLTSTWNHGYNWLIIVAAVNTAISIYYYLGLVRHAYTKDAQPSLPTSKTSTLAWAGALAAGVLILGILPGTVFDLAYQAGSTLIP